MKRIMSLTLAVLLGVMGLAIVAQAGGVGNVNPSQLPFQARTNQTFEPGKTVSIPLGWSSFASTDQTPIKPQEVTQAQVEQLSVYVDGGAAKNSEFTQHFAYGLQLLNPGTETAQIALALTPKDVAQDTWVEYKIGLTKLQGASTGSGYMGLLSGTIRAKVVTPDGDITGFSGRAPVASTVSIAGGESVDLPIPADLFQYAGPTDNTITMAKIQTYGITAGTGDSRFAAVIENRNGAPVVKVTAATATAAGTYTVDVTMSGSQNGLAGHSATTHRLTANVSQAVSPSGNRITGVDPAARLGATQNGIASVVTKNGKTLSGESPENLTVTAGDELEISFDSNFFLWENGKPNPAVSLSSSMIRSGRIAVKQTNASGKKVVDSVALAYDSGRAYIKVKFKEDYTVTKDQDFSLNIALAHNNSTVSGSAVTIAGTFEVNELEVYADTDYVDVSGGEVAIAMENVRGIQVDLGNGVLVNARMTKNKKYAGTASIDPTSADERIMDRYPDIEMVYNLKTTNLSGTGNTVTFEVDSLYYVYDGNLKYLGTTDQKLPYSNKYYLANRKLTVVDEVTVIEVPNGNGRYPTTSVTEPVIENRNDNPPTGK